MNSIIIIFAIVLLWERNWVKAADINCLPLGLDAFWTFHFILSRSCQHHPTPATPQQLCVNVCGRCADRPHALSKAAYVASLPMWETTKGWTGTHFNLS